LPHSLPARGETEADKSDRAIRNQISSLMLRSTSVEDVEGDVEQNLADEGFAVPKKKKKKEKAKKKKKSSQSSDEDAPSPPPSPPAPPTPNASERMLSSAAGSKLAARGKLSAVTRVSSSARVTFAPPVSEGADSPGSDTPAAASSAVRLFGAARASSRTDAPDGGGVLSRPTLSIAAAAKISAAAARISEPVLTKDPERQKALLKRRKENARRARRQLWLYRIRYMKAYFNRKRLLMQIALKAHRARQKVARRRIGRVTEQIPNPFDEYDYNVELVAEQYLSRALCACHCKAVARILSGWLLNWALLAALLFWAIESACELGAYDNGALGGPTIQLAAATWIFSSLLRLIVIEPLVVIGHLFVPGFVRRFLHTYIKGPRYEPGRFTYGSRPKLESTPTVVEVLNLESESPSRLGGLSKAVLAVSGVNRHSVVGTVTDDESKEPIAAARLTLTGGAGKYSESFNLVGTSGTDGTFTLADVPAGNYSLAFDVDGYERGIRTVIINSRNGAERVDQSMAKRGFVVKGLVSELETGDPIFGAALARDIETTEGPPDARTNEDGVFVISRMRSGPYKFTVTAAGFQAKTITFTLGGADINVGGVADVLLEAHKFRLSGGVTADGDGTPPITNAIAWLKKNGKIKQRVECSSQGVFDFGKVAGGLYNVVAGAPGYMKMRVAVTLYDNIDPGGKADLCLPKPLPPEADVGRQIAERVHILRAVFQHYCSAAVVGANNPFMMSISQVEEFMEALDLPGGLSENGSLIMQRLFDQVNGETNCGYRIDQKGDLHGGLRTDPDKVVDTMLSFDEFLDLQVQLAWRAGQMKILTARSFPFSRRGLGFALKQFLESIMLPRAESLELDAEFEEKLKSYKMPSNVTKAIKDAFEKSSTGKEKILDVESFVELIKKWRAVGTKLSILRARTIFVQYADPESGRVPYYVRDAEPADETVAVEENTMFEEEEDDDVIKAKLAAAQMAKLEASILAEKKTATVTVDKKSLGTLEKGERGVPRVPAQEMTFGEFKAAVCRLAWLLCKGQTLAERVEAFASMYVK
jgi:hypothetical protein